MPISTTQILEEVTIDALTAAIVGTAVLLLNKIRGLAKLIRRIDALEDRMRFLENQLAPPSKPS